MLAMWIGLSSSPPDRLVTNCSKLGVDASRGQVAKNFRIVDDREREKEVRSLP